MVIITSSSINEAATLLVSVIPAKAGIQFKSHLSWIKDLYEIHR